jgi:RNA polymerase sigma-70 factor (ECF subfamily)
MHHERCRRGSQGELGGSSLPMPPLDGILPRGTLAALLASEKGTTVDSHPEARTSASLLARLQHDSDPDAWSQFVRRYGPLLYRWCRAWDLQDADIEDVTQTVLLKLARRLRSFQYDPAQSFRAYLKTLVHYAWCDLLNDHRAAPGGGDSAVLRQLDSMAARDDLTQRLEAEFDRELLEQAMLRVQQRVEPQTWEAFRLTALEGQSGAAVAERLGMKVTAVFKARSRVQQMLRDELGQSPPS